VRSRKSYTAIVEIIRRDYALRPKKPGFLDNLWLCTKYLLSQKTRFLPSHSISFVLLNREVNIVNKRYFILIFTLLGLSTSCGQPKLFPEFERTFKNSNALEERSFNQQTDAIMLDLTNNQVQESRNNGKSDRTPKSPEEVWIVVWMWGYCLVCYLLVWKFRGREEAKKMLRRIRRRVK
jgi:hypothetical protein